ncbi:MAG: 4Fe-4S dicluster domain-containing protein [Caldimicrobium sp.]
MENALPMGYFRYKVDIADVGEYPNPKRHFFPKMCNQCDDPPCILPCPVPGATYKREDGIVMINKELCIGCGRCVEVKNDPSKYAKDVPEIRGKKAMDLRVADKCDYCSHRLAAGIEEPACVRSRWGFEAPIFHVMKHRKRQIMFSVNIGSNTI